MDVISDFKKHVRSHIDSITPSDQRTVGPNGDGSDAGPFSERFADSLDLVIDHAFADAERVQELCRAGESGGPAEALVHFADTFAKVYSSALKRALELEETG